MIKEIGMARITVSIASLYGASKAVSKSHPKEEMKYVWVKPVAVESEHEYERDKVIVQVMGTDGYIFFVCEDAGEVIVGADQIPEDGFGIETKWIRDNIPFNKNGSRLVVLDYEDGWLSTSMQDVYANSGSVSKIQVEFGKFPDFRPIVEKLQQQEGGIDRIYYDPKVLKKMTDVAIAYMKQRGHDNTIELNFVDENFVTRTVIRDNEDVKATIFVMSVDTRWG